ncbi:MAG: hypothetical protein H6957_01020 [Chromatiaceae bacterium]|nr:hypothetical protein [Chromatiaceae bacterium]
MSADEKKYLFDNPRNVRRVVRGLLIACVVLVGLDLVLHRHVAHPWEGVFGFYAFYGFVACVLLVLLAKEMRKLVMRDEDYYQRNDGQDGAGDRAGQEEDGHA